MILIIITFRELLFWIYPRNINDLRSYIKHSKECFIRYQNTSKLCFINYQNTSKLVKKKKKTRNGPRLSTNFLVFGYLRKRSSLCLIMIYYIKHKEDCCIRYPNTDKWLRKRRAARRVFFLTNSEVFGYQKFEKTERKSCFLRRLRFLCFCCYFLLFVCRFFFFL